MPEGVEITIEAAVRSLGTTYANLIRRGADGSLSLSADRWRIAALDVRAIRFTAQAEEADDLILDREDVLFATWDRLPKQHVRSQVRFYLRSGDLWTLSGAFEEPTFP
ncbi:MAG: hypothetical protein HYX52_09675 [Chloroflexi bacterium]|nr:hypothetical protein [Chloroflexota bacterium]